ncbi:MAG TPA: MlaD family protein, partial [Polyangiaceae bacterium]|nr:MlaD family protein [Polyangiaceae bacterium]
MAVSREIKVGSFVLAGLVGAGTIVFLIGDNRALFDSKVHYRAQFDDVQGVKPGSTVRMGGVDIGTVSRVEYSADKSKSDIEVDLSIVKREADRIREGSLASIAAKGLLGDKMVTVTPGSPDQPPIPPGGLIHSAPNEDFTQALGKIQELAGSAKNVMQNLELATGTLADAQLRDDVRRGVAALSSVLVSLDSGPGYAAKLLHDPKEAERVSALLSNLDQASARLDRVLAGVDDVVGQIKRGPGFAHEVLYGAEGSHALAQVGSAAEEVGKTLAGVREGNSLAHGLLYGTNGQGDSALGDQVAGDLSSMSSDL